MKKLLKGLLSGLLLLSISVSVVGCQDGQNNGSNQGNEVGGATTAIGTAEQVGLDGQRTYQGVHDLTAPEVETEDYIIKNGVFQYKLVFPALQEQTSSMVNARNEFRTLIQKATGITSLPTVTDTAIQSFSKDDKYISFGDNALLEKAGVTYDKSELKQNGGKILTVGKSVFILGGTDTGVLNAVYTFMQICFDYEYFSRNCVQINTGVKDLKLRNFNVTDVPDIDWVDISANLYASTYDSPSLIDQYALGETVLDDLKMRKYRLRSIYNEKSLIHYIEGVGHLGDTGGYFHNTANYIEPKSPDCEKAWVADSGRQICYTAHGDAEALERCKQHCAQKIIDALIRIPYAQNPEMNYVTLTEEDGGGTCNCKWCLADAEKYGGAKSAALVRFANGVIDLVYEWMNETDEEGNYVNEEYRRPTLRLAVFAYGEMKVAPAYYDETQGKYVPYDETVRPNDRVIAWACTGSAPWNWFESPYEENNAELKGKWVESWGDICALWWWGHSVGDNGWFFMQDFINGHNADCIQWLASMNTARCFFPMGGNDIALVWQDLSCYVFTQLCWDSSQSTGDLIERYCNAMFQDGAQSMLKLFTAQRTYYHVLNERSIQTTGKSMLLQEQYWSEEHYSYDVIRGFLDYYYQALKDISVHEESNPKLYAVLRDRVDSVAVTYYGMLFYIYGDSLTPPFTQEQRAIYKSELLTILERHPNVTGILYKDYLEI